MSWMVGKIEKHKERSILKIYFFIAVTSTKTDALPTKSVFFFANMAGFEYKPSKCSLYNLVTTILLKWSADAGKI